MTGLIDDSYAGPFPIGFDFSFYGLAYSLFYISSNGFIGFGPPDNYEALANRPMPNLETPNKIIALLWDDLNPLDSYNPGGTVHYKTLGDKLIVQYTNIPEYMADTGDVFTGEIILSRDGTIRLQYLSFGAGFDKFGSSVGTENQDGFDGLGVVYNASFLHDNLAVAISTPIVSWLSAEPDQGAVAPSQKDTVQLVLRSAGLAPGSYSGHISLHDSDPDAADSLKQYTATLTVQSAFTFGDANADENINISDAVYLIAYIFTGGQPPDPLGRGELNCDGSVNISDVVYLIAYIFAGGPPPCQT